MSDIGPLDLLIIQGSPFCNINCQYCYLPNRGDKNKISLTIVNKIFERIYQSDLVKNDFTVVWHAGEPMAINENYYSKIFDIINEHTPPNIVVSHSFQTNGTLLTDKWCSFIKQNKIRIGISVDGPDFIHDKYRVKRNGKGSHAETMRGIKLLKEHDIDFHAIAVVTAYSLNYPDKIFNFFLNNNIQRVGFNIEEIEGVNITSSIDVTSEIKVKRFFERIFTLQKQNKGKVIVREFESAFQKIIGSPISSNNTLETTIPRSHMLNTFGIISIDINGDFTSFSPELLGQTSPEFNNFILGNVMRDSFVDVLTKKNYNKISEGINKGVEMCKETCSYFKVCGGGAPSNKFYETGTFKSTETIFCKNTIKTPIDIVLSDLEKTYSIK
ncbi:cyclophane-forming radical SAM/SPASM peptide maturase GrrM/OscB [Cyclobacterium amurskyense]|uniref:Arylsulfatase regulator (Fe-S oxidoreductase) n=1 Tax=Cyclobacterium amurskyense TaxID=320787 RepID=A0A0H4PBE4_9BACT|nr:cyclophane-forming radical SAM/SPASM peptide maturase GrrM/OscB [Cyclobacterium amurskyense]AKP51544.1 Arylsulfatase regulator (Fe-S oxidoreductase) [Cyclobacterium amurskyense]